MQRHTGSGVHNNLPWDLGLDVGTRIAYSSVWLAAIHFIYFSPETWEEFSLSSLPDNVAMVSKQDQFRKNELQTLKLCTHIICLTAQLCLILCDSMDYSLPVSSVHGDSPGKSTGVGCHVLLQGIFPTQGSNPGLPHCSWILYRLSHQEAQSLTTPYGTWTHNPWLRKPAPYPLCRDINQDHNLCLWWLWSL